MSKSKKKIKPCTSEMLYEMMLLTGAGVKLEEMPETEVLELFDSWTQQQRDQAEEYFANVYGGANAGEWNESHPAVKCPEHLKPYGCHDYAAVKAAS